MQKIIFYEDSKGNSPVRDYTNRLFEKGDKDSKIKIQRVRRCIDKLENEGTRAGERFVKHIEDEIWELRPLPNRILFAAYIEDSFVLLHQFRKDTQKTPRREIDRAKKELADYKERIDSRENFR